MKSWILINNTLIKIEIFIKLTKQNNFMKKLLLKRSMTKTKIITKVANKRNIIIKDKMNKSRIKKIKRNHK